jgi:hypothetical protein
MAWIWLVIFASPATAFAHALHVEARLKGNQIRIEAFFSDDTPAQNARVSVANKLGEEVAAGKTDETGVFTIPRLAAEHYVVTVDAEDGHRTKVTVTIPSDAALRARTSTPAETEVVVTEGPTRSERRRFPWLRVAIGLGAVAALAGALWLATRRGSTNNRTMN